jgi:hypothetical protein
MVHWTVAAGIPAIFFVMGLPLAFALVPPNRWYGFRTALTLSNPSVWYPVNRTAGWSIMAAAVLAGLANLVLLLCFGDAPPQPVSSWISMQCAGWAVLAMIPPWLHSRRL